ncbi:P1 family peptidase, partial [Desulfovibrio desulfuricans]|nr:P1 family peptidase [Desulfovibrio desulfuricans]
ELGTLESPIALTNTLSVGTVQQALVKYMLRDHPEIGTTGGSVNVVVGECNDGYLNDIRACCIQEEDVYDAIKDAKENFELGAVGA